MRDTLKAWAGAADILDTLITVVQLKGNTLGTKGPSEACA
jgi:hypothetical protein